MLCKFIIQLFKSTFFFGGYTPAFQLLIIFYLVEKRVEYMEVCFDFLIFILVTCLKS